MVDRRCLHARHDPGLLERLLELALGTPLPGSALPPTGESASLPESSLSVSSGAWSKSSSAMLSSMESPAPSAILRDPVLQGLVTNISKVDTEKWLKMVPSS